MTTLEKKIGLPEQIFNYQLVMMIDVIRGLGCVLRTRAGGLVSLGGFRAESVGDAFCMGTYKLIISLSLDQCF